MVIRHSKGKGILNNEFLSGCLPATKICYGRATLKIGLRLETQCWIKFLLSRRKLRLFCLTFVCLVVTYKKNS
jgi:hypothetical protein